MARWLSELLKDLGRGYPDWEGDEFSERLYCGIAHISRPQDSEDKEACARVTLVDINDAWQYTFDISGGGTILSATEVSHYTPLGLRGGKFHVEGALKAIRRTPGAGYAYTPLQNPKRSVCSLEDLEQAA